MKKEFKEWLIAIIVAILLLFLVNNFLFKPYTVSGLSMYPTFNNQSFYKVIIAILMKYNNISRL